jgi:hypothetical protein
VDQSEVLFTNWLVNFTVELVNFETNFAKFGTFWQKFCEIDCNGNTALKFNDANSL